MRHRAALLAFLLIGAACSDGGSAASSTTREAPPSTTTVVSPTTTTAPATTTTTTSTTSSTTTTTAPIDIERLARGTLLIGLEGLELDQATAAHLEGGGAGLILFDRNIADTAQVTGLTALAACAADHPLLIAVDQEPGPIARLGEDLVSRLPKPEQAMTFDPETWAGVAAVLGGEMMALGINMDLAPIVDVVAGVNPVLEERHFGDDPTVVAELGAAFVEGLSREGVIGVLKHFPGHGRSETDPHTGVVRIDASAADLATVDWPPFELGIESGAAAVMLGHPIYDALDPELPASISPIVLALLRGRFGFEGVAITDSLSMPGVAEGRSPGELAVAALAAGEDLLLVEAPFHVEPMVAEIVAAIGDGRLSIERLQEAAARAAVLAGSAGRVACDA